MKSKAIKAFTLVEMMIAIAIFSIGVLTVLNLLVNNLYFLDKASTKTQASFLAKEGIELVYNLRDSNNLKAYPRNCIPKKNAGELSKKSFGNNSSINNETEKKKICVSILGEDIKDGKKMAFSINFSPEEYFAVSEIAELPGKWDDIFERYKLEKQEEESKDKKKYTYYTTSKSNNDDFSKFARYIIVKPLVEKKSDGDNVENISTKNIVKLESHVLYKNGTKTGEVIFESFIGNY